MAYFKLRSASARLGNISMEYSTLGAVDLGSNSFHLAIARVVDDQLYPLDSLRETVRLAAGLAADKNLDERAQERALAALKVFSERLAGMPRQAVRVVGTNALRVAKNSAPFLRRAQQVLGFPIEVIPGREEARLIYLGVAHSLPLANHNRLVVDIGGGSTEFIVGHKMRTKAMESLYMGCVSYTDRFFGDGRIDKKGFRQAELAAREQVQTIAARYEKEGWKEAVGSSGMARSIAEVLQKGGHSSGTITAPGLQWLRQELLEAGEWDETRAALPIALGRDLEGKAVVADLAKMPHLLIAGATGSGKSVAINTIITSLVYRYTPKQLRFLMVDPKMVELSMYNALPHLRHKVITNNNDAAALLKWAEMEMQRRYELLHANGARNLADFNRKAEEGKPLRNPPRPRRPGRTRFISGFALATDS